MKARPSILVIFAAFALAGSAGGQPFGSGDQVVTMMPNSKLFTAVRYIGDTNNVVATNTDGLPRMYRANDGGLFLNLSPVSDYLHSVDVTPNQQTVIAGGHRGTLYIWNGQNGQLLHRLDPAAAP